MSKSPTKQDFEHFPGMVDPVKHMDIFGPGSPESRDGLSAPDELSYPAADYTQDPTPIETLDQHDLNLDHPPVNTPSGVDHVNPRGQISTDGKLDVPEDTVGYVPLEKAIDRILKRNFSRIVTRSENPGIGILRTVSVDGVNPFRIGTQDDMRAMLRLWVVSGSSLYVGTAIGDVMAGNAATLTAIAGILQLDYHDDVYVMSTVVGTPSVMSYYVSRWEVHAE